MNIWLVNPFDPLPGDVEQRGRYASLCKVLHDRGHHVTWFTSAFSHRFKRPVDQAALTAACGPLSVTPVFLEAPAYPSNVSLRRLWSHRLLTKAFVKAASQLARQHRPDVVLVSSPLPGLALAAVEFAHRQGVKAIVDIQDLWPETFLRLGPPALRPVLAAILSPMQRSARRAYGLADAIVGVADGYVQRAVDLTHSAAPTKMIPLGVELADFDAAVAAGRCDQYGKPAGEIWLAYTGSLSRSYDCQTVLEGFLLSLGELKARGLRPKLWISGRGEMKDVLASRIRQAGAQDHVEMLGFLDFPTWAYLLSQCDVGFNSNFPEAMIFLPNKIFYYLAAGLAVLNTIPGQASRIVSEGKCGLDYTAGNPQSCCRQLLAILENPSSLATMKASARDLASQVFDRSVLLPAFAEFIEKTACGST